jgi:SAM-dependent methyltransferase
LIALDFLPEMLQRTAAAAHQAGLKNVEPVEGEMEAIPLPDASVDLVISNGVINLSARKARVMAECARVLRPGGRLCVSDLTVEQDDLPANSSRPASLRSRCCTVSRSASTTARSTPLLLRGHPLDEEAHPRRAAQPCRGRHRRTGQLLRATKDVTPHQLLDEPRVIAPPSSRVAAGATALPGF